MPDVTVSLPQIGLESFFRFKEPVNGYFRTKLNVDPNEVKLKVISVISMKDMIRNDLRDPFSEVYIPAGISEVDYKLDLNDNIPIISFSYKDFLEVERYIRCPLNYIESIESIANIEYVNKLIVIDLNKLPTTVDTTLFFTDLADFVRTRLGVTPAIKEVSVGYPVFYDIDNHENLETIRRNTVTVHKTLSAQLEEANLRHDQLLQRLQVLNIVLG